MHHNPDNWKWGFIYFNPEDPRLFVPKRNPALGFTFNFAHRYLGLFLLSVMGVVLLFKFILK